MMVGIGVDPDVLIPTLRGRGTRAEDKYPKGGEQHEYLTASEYRGEGVEEDKEDDGIDHYAKLLSTRCLALSSISMLLASSMSVLSSPLAPGPGGLG